MLRRKCVIVEGGGESILRGEARGKKHCTTDRNNQSCFEFMAMFDLSLTRDLEIFQ